MKICDRLAAMMAFITYGASIGRTALNKLLWFADVVHFLRCGKTISGARYGKLQYGPAPVMNDDVRNALIQQDILREQQSISNGYRTFTYEANRDRIDLRALRKVFSAEERETIIAVIKALRDKTGKYLSEKSHRFEPWVSARFGDELDLDRAKTDEKLREWLQELKLMPRRARC